jgi:pimeloyl-ACP methyl ester carboxylesterase
MHALLAAFAVLALMLPHDASATDGMKLVQAFKEPMRGPDKAEGVIVWSHGRSINSEDSESETPPYLGVLGAAGWDVMRFERLTHFDVFPNNGDQLVAYVDELKNRGYKRVALAGQSLGAFVSLMAASGSDKVDAVIATAPAAHGNFDEFYNTWQSNATRLYSLLESVKSARVMMFYFHGDDFDPGGRGEKSREILVRNGYGYSVIDQPEYLKGHWAASLAVFSRRFGECIRDFVNATTIAGEFPCQPIWGTKPSAELNLPSDFNVSKKSLASSTVGSSGNSLEPVAKIRDVWYGFYPNGREVLFAVESLHGSEVDGLYAVGPGMDGYHPATWSRRKGQANDGYVFSTKRQSKLRLIPLQNGRLRLTWTSRDGKTVMTAYLRHIDPEDIVYNKD